MRKEEDLDDIGVGSGDRYYSFGFDIYSSLAPSCLQSRGIVAEQVRAKKNQPPPLRTHRLTGTQASKLSTLTHHLMTHTRSRHHTHSHSSTSAESPYAKLATARQSDPRPNLPPGPDHPSLFHAYKASEPTPLPGRGGRATTCATSFTPYTNAATGYRSPIQPTAST